MSPKLTIKITILCCCFFLKKATSQTSVFFHNNWQAAVQQAKAENKPIFVDFYTSWCGPCRWMEKNVFPNPVVSDFFARRFVLFKADAEKGSGIKLAEVYEPTSFPTYLCLTPDGDELYRFSGLKNVKDFLLELEFGIRVGREAKSYQASLNSVLLDDNSPVEELHNQVLDKEQIRDRIEELAKNGIKIGDLLDKYFELLSDKERLEDETIIFLIDYLPNFDSKVGHFLFKHHKEVAYRNQRAIQTALSEFYEEIVKNRNEQQLATFIEYETIFLSPSLYFPADFRINKTKIRYLDDTKQVSRLQQGIIDYVELKLLKANTQFIDTKFQVETNPRKDVAGEVVSPRQKLMQETMIGEINAELSFYANKLLLTTNSTPDLKKALNWSLKSHKQNQNAGFWFTTAQIYEALGQRNDASFHAQEALKFAKANNENTVVIEDFLKQL